MAQALGKIVEAIEKSGAFLSGPRISKLDVQVRFSVCLHGLAFRGNLAGVTFWRPFPAYPFVFLLPNKGAC